MSAFDDEQAWLAQVLDKAEAEAPHAHLRGCPAWDDYHYRHSTDPRDRQPTAGDACECNGPQRAAARLAGERAVLVEIAESTAEFPDFDGGRESGLEEAASFIAWGHRFDAPGYDPAWAPEGAEVPA